MKTSGHGVRSNVPFNSSSASAFPFFFNSLPPLAHPRSPILALFLSLIVAFYSVRFGPLAVWTQKIYRVDCESRALVKRARYTSCHSGSLIEDLFSNKICRSMIKDYNLEIKLELGDI